MLTSRHGVSNDYVWVRCGQDTIVVDISEVCWFKSITTLVWLPFNINHCILDLQLSCSFSLLSDSVDSFVNWFIYGWKFYFWILSSWMKVYTSCVRKWREGVQCVSELTYYFYFSSVMSLFKITIIIYFGVLKTFFILSWVF